MSPEGLFLVVMSFQAVPTFLVLSVASLNTGLSTLELAGAVVICTFVALVIAFFGFLLALVAEQDKLPVGLYLVINTAALVFCIASLAAGGQGPVDLVSSVKLSALSSIGLVILRYAFAMPLRSKRIYTRHLY